MTKAAKCHEPGLPPYARSSRAAGGLHLSGRWRPLALSTRLRAERETRAQELETRKRAELEKTHQDGAEKLQVLRQRHEAERVQDDRLLQTRAAERGRDRATMQAHIVEVKRADRAGQIPEQEAPARFKAGDHWEAKDDRTQKQPGTVSEKLEEAARRRQQDRGRARRRSWE